ncbi:MAG: fused MFS/spermidine synthase [Candidatus Liptonbacteria bacterium]|nr:fused MFS/spermidine synthase [Candidatus Liptonbacteria bacterium]
MTKIKSFIFLFLVFAIGLSTLILEITGARFLAPFFGSTIFVWSSLISATLGGLAFGYFLGGRLSRKEEKEEKIFYFLVFSLGLIMLLVPGAVRPLSEYAEQFGLRFGPLFAALLIFFPAFAIVGATTPLSVKIYARGDGPGPPAGRQAGAAAGYLYALGTAGSLLGALLTGFFLIPILPLSIILSISGFVLIVPALFSLFFSGKVNNKVFGGLLLFFILAGMSLSAINAKEKTGGLWVKIVDRATTFYTGLKVIEYGNLRCILGGLKLYSCVNKDTGLASDDFTVIRDGMNPFVERIPAGGSALLLGGGSGMALEKLPGGVHGVLVELDPAVTTFAEKYFGLNPEKRELIADDARHAVRVFAKQGRKFDLVIMDVIADTTIPNYIMSREAFSELASILKPEGVLIIHGGIATEEPKEDDIYLGSILKTAESEFPWGKIVWRDDSNSRNVIFYFSKNPIPETRIPEIKIAKARIPLTDDFNPLDYYNQERQLKLTAELRSFLGGVILR